MYNWGATRMHLYTGQGSKARCGKTGAAHESFEFPKGRLARARPPGYYNL